MELYDIIISPKNTSLCKILKNGGHPLYIIGNLIYLVKH